MCEVSELVGLFRVDTASNIQIEKTKVAASSVKRISSFPAILWGVVGVVWEIRRYVYDRKRISVQWKRRVGFGKWNWAVGGSCDGHGCMLV